MPDPIVFISHSAIKQGQLDGLRDFLRTGAKALDEEKPGTVAFLAYIDDSAESLSIVHVFPSADAMTAHLQGVEQRSQEADAFIETTGYEIYGSPDEGVLGMMRAFAANSGVPLELHPEPVGGYLRLGRA
jgi:quinol monooxygenase YgiN